MADDVAQGPADGTEDQSPDPDMTNELPPITGTWAQKQVLASIAVLPVGGAVNRDSTTYQIVKFVQDGQGFTGVVDVCTVFLNSGTELAVTTLPQSASDAIANSDRSGTLEKQPDGSWSFKQGTFVDLRGAQLANPLTDPLPTSPDDPAVVDQDQDGHPGITVILSGPINGEVYVTQRITATHSGTYSQADRLDGSVEFLDEQVFLGATNEVLMTPTQAVPDPDATASYFRSVRVDQEADCAWLMQNLDKVFP